MMNVIPVFEDDAGEYFLSLIVTTGTTIIDSQSANEASVCFCAPSELFIIEKKKEKTVVLMCTWAGVLNMYRVK